MISGIPADFQPIPSMPRSLLYTHFFKRLEWILGQDSDREACFLDKSAW